MDYFEDVQSLVEASKRATDLDALKKLFGSTLGRYGCDKWACVSHVDPINPPPGAVVALDYPGDWVQYFSEQGFDQYDPVYETATNCTVPFRWTDAVWRSSLSPRQIGILNQATDAGLHDGISVPIQSARGIPASCSVSIPKEGIDPAALHGIHLMALYFHEAARRIASSPYKHAHPARILTDRQRRCLEWAAQGKSDGVIGELLKISENTVKFHIKACLEKFGVATRAQAIVRALYLGEIRYFDVLVDFEHRPPALDPQPADLPAISRPAKLP